jgi:hypothetical protein
VDGRFVHVLTPNIYRTLGEAKQTFNYITDKGNFGYFDRELARWSGVAIMVRAVLSISRVVAYPLSVAAVHFVTHASEKEARHHG